MSLGCIRLAGVVDFRLLAYSNGQLTSFMPLGSSQRQVSALISLLGLNEQLRAMKVLIANVFAMLGLQPCGHYECITSAVHAPQHAESYATLDKIPVVRCMHCFERLPSRAWSRPVAASEPCQFAQGVNGPSKLRCGAVVQRT